MTRRVTSTSLHVAAFLAAGLAPGALGDIGVAHAQGKVCVPRAVGVPGRPGPPDWWTTPDTTSTRDIDPRWKTALRITDIDEGLAGFEGLAMRAVFHPGPPDATGNKHLYLSWKVEGDPFFSDPDEPVASRKRVFVGIGPDCDPGSAGCDASKFFVVALNAVDDGNAVPIQPLTVHAVYRYQSEDAAKATFALDTAGASLAWKDTARAWFSAADQTWSMQVRVPDDAASVAQGLPLPDDIRMFYWVEYTQTKIGSTLLRITYTWPRDADEAAFNLPDFGSITAIKPQGWGRFHLGPDGSADCQIGVSLAATDIGVAPGACPADPSTLKSATLTSDISRTSANCFVARPRNNDSAVSIAANKLEVSFRLANWGSSIDFGEWMDLMKYRLSPAPIRNAGAIAGSPGASGTDNVGVLAAEWHPTTDEERCLYVPGFVPSSGACAAGLTPRGTHQCILAELKAYDSKLVLLNDSIHRNMNFLDASSGDSLVAEVARVKARSFFALPRKVQQDLIKVGVVRDAPFLRAAGVSKVPASALLARARPVSRRARGTYELYFRVEKHQLEPVIHQRVWRQRYFEVDRVYRELEKAVVPARVRAPARVPPGRVVTPIRGRVTRPGPGVTLPGATVTAAAVRALSLRDLQLRVPSVVVFVYRDTGHVMREGGKTFRVARPQPSFGAFVKPPRNLEGWHLALDGVEPVGGDVFKATVADGGEAALRVRLLPKTPQTRRVAFQKPEPLWRDPADTRINPPAIPGRVQPVRPIRPVQPIRPVRPIRPVQPAPRRVPRPVTPR